MSEYDDGQADETTRGGAPRRLPDPPSLIRAREAAMRARRASGGPKASPASPAASDHGTATPPADDEGYVSSAPVGGTHTDGLNDFEPGLVAARPPGGSAARDRDASAARAAGGPAARTGLSAEAAPGQRAAAPAALATSGPHESAGSVASTGAAARPATPGTHSVPVISPPPAGGSSAPESGTHGAPDDRSIGAQPSADGGTPQAQPAAADPHDGSAGQRPTGAEPRPVAEPFVRLGASAPDPDHDEAAQSQTGASARPVTPGSHNAGWQPATATGAHPVDAARPTVALTKSTSGVSSGSAAGDNAVHGQVAQPPTDAASPSHSPSQQGAASSQGAAGATLPGSGPQGAMTGPQGAAPYSGGPYAPTHGHPHAPPYQHRPHPHPQQRQPESRPDTAEQQPAPYRAVPARVSVPVVRPELAGAEGKVRHGDTFARRTGRYLKRLLASSSDHAAVMAAVQAIQQPLASGRQFAVTSIRGGSGKSTVAALLALTFAHHRTDPVLAVEADPALGTLPRRLSATEVRWSCADLARIIDPSMQITDLIGYLLPFPGGGWLLPGSQGTVGAQLDLDTYRTVMTSMQRYFAATVVDCQTLPAEVARTALTTTQARVLVAPATVEGVAATRTVLEWLGNLHRSMLPTTVVALTHTTPDSTLDVRRSTELLQQGGAHVIPLPYDRHLAGGGAIRTELLAVETQEAAARLAGAVMDRAATR